MFIWSHYGSHYTVKIAIFSHPVGSKYFPTSPWIPQVSVMFLWSVLHLILDLCDIKNASRTSLVVQWLRICLPMQGTQVRALVREDPTCRGAAKPMSHHYWVCALEPASHNYWAHVPQLLKPVHLEPVLCNKRSHRNEKPAHHNKD